MSEFGIFRVAKVNSAGITNVQNHNKQKKEHADFLASRNENFNKEHLELNRHLVESDGFRADISRILKEHNITKTKSNAVKMLDALVTYSPEKTKNLCCYLNQNNQRWLKDETHQKWMEEYNAIPEDKRLDLVNKEKEWADNYFDRALEWYKENFGYVISAEVHYTESTPHLHINSVPIVDRGNGKFSLSARDLVGNDRKMHAMQTNFYEEVGKIFGLERGIERKPGESYKRRKTKNQWEIEQQEKAAEEARQEVQEARETIKDLEDAGEDLKIENKALEDTNRALMLKNEVLVEVGAELRQKNDEEQLKLLDTCADIEDKQSLLVEVTEAVASKNQELIDKQMLMQKETENQQVTYAEFSSAVTKFLSICLPALEVISNRIKDIFKAIDEHKAQKLNAKIQEPQKRASNAVEKGTKAIEAMGKSFTFGSTGTGLDALKKTTEEIVQASNTIESATKQMTSICNAFEKAEEEEDPEIEFDF